MMPPPGHADESYRRPRKLRLAVILVGLALWSLLAWAVYSLVDPALGLVAESAGVVLESGKNLATSTGAGQEVGGLVDGWGGDGLLRQALALLPVVAKPAIVIVWAIGALGIVAAPLVLSKVGRMLRARRH